MTLPDTEVLTSLVARVFRIDDVTAGDPEKGPLLRYRGHLLSDDSASAYDQLAASVKPHGLTPLFRLEKGEQVIYLTKSPPEQKPCQSLGECWAIRSNGFQRDAGWGHA